MALYEIRDYHYRRDRWAEYLPWGREARRILCERFDVVGFWLDAGLPAKVGGSDPVDSPHGPANITWVIRWDDMEQRDAGWRTLYQDEEWTNHWESHPDNTGYLQITARFLEDA